MSDQSSSNSKRGRAVAGVLTGVLVFAVLTAVFFLVRSGGDEFNFWTGSERVNPLYGTRYAIDTLRPSLQHSWSDAQWQEHCAALCQTGVARPRFLCVPADVNWARAAPRLALEPPPRRP